MNQPAVALGRAARAGLLGLERPSNTEVGRSTIHTGPLLGRTPSLVDDDDSTSAVPRDLSWSSRSPVPVPVPASRRRTRGRLIVYVLCTSPSRAGTAAKMMACRERCVGREGGGAEKGMDGR